MKTRTFIPLLALLYLKQVALTLAVFTLFSCSPEPKAYELEEVVTHLNEGGYTVTERSPKWYQLIGATDGASLQINSQNIEIYVYDLSITSGRERFEAMLTDGFWGQRGYGFANLLVVFHNHPNQQGISELLEAL